MGAQKIFSDSSEIGPHFKFASYAPAMVSIKFYTISTNAESENFNTRNFERKATGICCFKKKTNKKTTRNYATSSNGIQQYSAINNSVDKYSTRDRSNLHLNSVNIFSVSDQ